MTEPSPRNPQWSHGETVVVRNIAHSDGSVTTAIPMVVICDDADCLALYLPAGTLFLDNYNIAPDDREGAVGKAPPSRQREHRERRWDFPVLRLYMPGTAFSAWLFFDAQWEFTGWYGNLEAPYQRTPIGIDTQDHALDVVADERLRWRFKDEDEFERRLVLGIDTPEHQASVRSAAAELVDRLKNASPPFDRDWLSWRPYLEWGVPRLPPNWAEAFDARFRLREPR